MSHCGRIREAYSRRRHDDGVLGGDGLASRLEVDRCGGLGDKVE